MTPQSRSPKCVLNGAGLGIGQENSEIFQIQFLLPTPLNHFDDPVSSSSSSHSNGDWLSRVVLSPGFC
jgi:hypothetical protein